MEVSRENFTTLIGFEADLVVISETSADFVLGSQVSATRFINVFEMMGQAAAINAKSCCFRIKGLCFGDVVVTSS